MNTGQQVTFGLALALVIASLWRGQQIQPLWQALTNQQTQTQIGPPLLNVGKDILALIVLVWLAGLSPDASKMTAALLVALWLLFLFHGTTLNIASAAFTGVGKS